MLNQATHAALNTVEGLRAAAKSNLTHGGSMISEYSGFLGTNADRHGYGLTGPPVPQQADAALNLTGLGAVDDDPRLNTELEAALSFDAISPTANALPLSLQEFA